MSNDDVREAFNICVSGGENPDCDTCPYKDIYDYRECFIVLRRHALELINRQKAEIEFLKQEALTPVVTKIGDEVARREKIKAEAIKEFAEKLKKLYETYPDDEEASALYLIRQINEIVKEMKGNNDE